MTRPEVGVLVMAHGTPATLEQLPAFYTEIRRGRPPTPEQLGELRRRYQAIGGTSPLNRTTRAQAEGLARALDACCPERFTVRTGARFADPRIEDGVAELLDRGVSGVVGIVLTPHSSPVSTAQYEKRLRDALAAGGGPSLHMVEHWYDAPRFAELVAERVRGALGPLEDGGAHRVEVVFTAHSIPTHAAGGAGGYPQQVADSAGAAARAAGLTHWRVAWQSAGRTDDQWLGPDVREVIAELPGHGADGVVVCPIGFVADHLEVLYDVDIEARAAAEAAGLAFARTSSFNAADDFCGLLADVVVRAAGPREP